MLRLSVAIFIILFTAFSLRAEAALIAGPNSQTTTQNSQLKLVWQDDFNNFDHNSWRPLNPDQGRMNREDHCYTSDKKNVRIENRNLILQSHINDTMECPYTSASIITRGKKSFLYGRIEVRAKVPGGNGLWPAIWMLPESAKHGSNLWPDNGEIDLLESVFNEPVVHASVHNFERYGKDAYHGVHVEPDYFEKFNIYALEWTENEIKILFNEKILVHHFKKEDWRHWPFDQPLYLIINLAIGGNWGASRGIDRTKFPAQMEIDYVRYYEWVK